MEWMTKAMFSAPKLNEKKSVGTSMCLQMSLAHSLYSLVSARDECVPHATTMKAQAGVF